MKKIKNMKKSTVAAYLALAVICFALITAGNYQYRYESHKSEYERDLESHLECLGMYHDLYLKLSSNPELAAFGELNFRKAHVLTSRSEVQLSSKGFDKMSIKELTLPGDNAFASVGSIFGNIEKLINESITIEGSRLVFNSENKEEINRYWNELYAIIDEEFRLD